MGRVYSKPWPRYSPEMRSCALGFLELLKANFPFRLSKNILISLRANKTGGVNRRNCDIDDLPGCSLIGGRSFRHMTPHRSGGSASSESTPIDICLHCYGQQSVWI